MASLLLDSGLIEFDASGLASGTYFYKIQAGSNIITRKIIPLK